MNIREHLIAACLGIALPTIAVIGSSSAAAGAAPNETAKTAAAVIAID